MSYYYNYYLGYEHDGKLYPWGVYDAGGKLHSVITVPGSFASDLHEDFDPVSEEMVSDELRKEFEYTDWNGKKTVPVKYLKQADLPAGSFIKTGYFLISDVKSYEAMKKEGELAYFDGFCDTLSPEVYAAMMQKELTFGKNPVQKDEEGNEYKEHDASDYMYYAYPDYTSKEYESWLLRETISMFEFSKIPEGAKYVILETEG